MEGNRVCQICNRSFSNGKAMGGHMRSHFAKLLLPTHISTPSSPHPLNISPRLTPQSSPDRRLPFVKDSDPPSHDGLESNITKLGSGDHGIDNKLGRESPDEVVKSPAESGHGIDNKLGRESPDEVVKSPAESGQGSLASDITFSDEEVAMCLVMLSRDTWPSDESEAGESRDYRDSDDCEDDESIRRIRARVRNKGRFKCETCNKVFGSYQALGGHRAGHKKVKLHRKKDEVLLEDGGGDNYCSAGNGNGNNNDGCSHKIFKCRYCGKVFKSGQALGGHKKVHVQLSGDSPDCSAAASSSKCKVTRKVRQSSLIDLNQLPDPETNIEESKPFDCIKRRIF